ncbi:MAG: T9SS type A sorting domain-containing protein, partial [Ginsengibacter sp.]
NTSTTIKYNVPLNSKVSLKVYNALGQAIATLFEGDRKAGTYTVSFKASKLTQGLYFCKLTALSAKQQIVQSIKLSVGK